MYEPKNSAIIKIKIKNGGLIFEPLLSLTKNPIVNISGINHIVLPSLSVAAVSTELPPKDIAVPITELVS